MGKPTLMWSALAAAIVGALAAAYLGYSTADRAWSAVVDYDTPFVDEGLPPAAAGPAITDRVVLIIVDGMGEDVSRQMSTLETLREYGSDITVLTGQPSLSYPTWTTILSGAPHAVNGVTTNWYEGRVKVETLIDTALAAKKRVVVVGPPDFEDLYGVQRADGVYLEDWEEEYLSDRLVDEALRLAADVDPEFLLLHLPDLDEAGHDSGAASSHYAEIAERVDADLNRLIRALQDSSTTFVIASDHGHVDTGGHGGWEQEVVWVPVVFAGGGVGLASDEALQSDIAPTVSTLLGIPTPRFATGHVLESVVATFGAEVLRPARAQSEAMVASYLRTVGAEPPSSVELASMSVEDLDQLLKVAVGERIREDRSSRLPVAASIALVAIALIVLVGLLSRQALLSAGAGALVYYAVYSGLFFGVHGATWSLSSFNSEDLIDAFFNARLAEAAIAGLAAAAVAGLVYPFLRESPKAARGAYLAGWLALGPMTVLVIQATLGIQAAIYVWTWGIELTSYVPDLMWGFKFDLDLVQITALGGAALLAPLVTYLVGRYHPKVPRLPGTGRTASAQE